MTTVLELDDVVGGYGETQILHGVSMKVDPGEIIAIIGPNGAGKSTAMKAVFGLLRLSSGVVRLGGEDITNTPPDQRFCIVCGQHVPRKRYIAQSHCCKYCAYERTLDWQRRNPERYHASQAAYEHRRKAARRQERAAHAD